MICGENISVRRRSHRLQQRSVADEIDISVDRKAGRRQETCGRDHVIAIEAETVGQPEPAGDPAVLVVAVVIDNPLAPLAAYRRGRQPGDRYASLIGMLA